MRLAILSLALIGLVSCHDGRTWESETNGPGANMATCNQHMDINTVPANNRTGNPEYHLRMEAERTGAAPAKSEEKEKPADKE